MSKPHTHSCVLLHSTGEHVDARGDCLPAFLTLSPALITERLQEASQSGCCMPTQPRIIPADRIKLSYSPDGAFRYVNSGTFGDVFHAELLRSGSKTGRTRVVIKMFKKSAASCGNDSHIISEAAKMTLANGMNCSPTCQGLVFLSPSDKYESVALVSTFLGDRHGQIMDVAKAFAKYGDDAVEVACLVKLMFKKLEQLARKGIVMCDIKADNILVKETGGNLLPYFIDFGNAVVKGSVISYNISKFQGPEDFLRRFPQIAPESVYESYVSHKTDIWSMGAMLERLVRGRSHLYPLMAISQVCKSVDYNMRPDANQISAFMSDARDSFVAQEVFMAEHGLLVSGATYTAVPSQCGFDNHLHQQNPMRGAYNLNAYVQ